MAKPKSRKRVSEYDSDDGFVEDAPTTVKKQKTSPNLTKQKDDDGNDYWEISGKRRVQVSDFKGQNFVNIREFYEKDGKTLPGKKGIAMNIEQYAAFVALLPDIEETLKGKGIEVPRPQYDGDGGRKKDVKDEDPDEDGDEMEQAGEEDEEEDQVEAEAVKGKGKLDKFKFGGKKDRGTTSEDDDGD